LSPDLVFQAVRVKGSSPAEHNATLYDRRLGRGRWRIDQRKHPGVMTVIDLPDQRKHITEHGRRLGQDRQIMLRFGYLSMV
jgi:hypothetical protein